MLNQNQVLIIKPKFKKMNIPVVEKNTLLLPNDNPVRSMNHLYPIFLKVENLEVLIVGGGHVALEKITGLLKSSPDAKVTLVAPDIRNEIYLVSQLHIGVKLIKKEFEYADLIYKDIVIVAADNKELNLTIKQHTKKLKILTNVADTPDLCDFYLGSVVTKGDLKIAISTNGKSPTFAKRLRKVLEDILPAELPELLINLRMIRDKLKGDFSQKVKILNEVTSSLVINK